MLLEILLDMLNRLILPYAAFGLHNLKGRIILIPDTEDEFACRLLYLLEGPVWHGFGTSASVFDATPTVMVATWLTPSSE